MANETTVVYGTQVTLESAGASVANNAMGAASTTAYALATNGSNYPDAEFVLAVTFATAPTAGTVVSLHAWPQSVQSTNNTQQPTATRPEGFVGSGQVDAVTTTQYIRMFARDLPANAKYQPYNIGTGQAFTWALYATPRTYKPA